MPLVRLQSMQLWARAQAAVASAQVWMPVKQDNAATGQAQSDSIVLACLAS